MLAVVMNDAEVTMFLAKVIAWGIFIYFVYCFFYGILNESVKALKIPERFDIGYFDGHDPVIKEVVVVEKSTPKKKKPVDEGQPEAPKPEPVKKKKQPKKVVSKKTTKKSCPADDALHRDCVDTLVALGTKKSEARRVAAKCLVENPTIKTVQEFVSEVFKRGNA